MSITLLRGYFQTRRIRHITRRGLQASADWDAECQTFACQLAIKRRVELVFSGEVVVPLTWGAFHPVIVLPTSALNWLPERRRIVLLHELAHIARWDYVTQWIALVSCAVNWFNPLAWHLRHQLALERERACDDQVLASGVKSSEYAANLLDIARSVTCWRTVLPSTLTVTTTSNLGSRIRHILDNDQKRYQFSRRRGLSLLLTLTITLLPFSAARFSSVSAQNNPVTITLAVDSGRIDEFQNTVVKDFEAAHPGVTVHLVESQPIPDVADGLDAYFTALQKYASSADVLYFDGYNLALTPQATRAGYILNLSPLINSDSSFNADDFYPQMWSSFQWDNSIWGVPMAADIAMLTYNQAAMDRAGLPYPDGHWNLGQFVDAVTKLSVKDSTGHLVASGFANSGRIFRESLWRSLFGAGLLDMSSNPNVPRFDLPDVKAVVDAYHQLENQGLIGSDTGSTAMYVDTVTGKPADPGWKWSLLPGSKAVLLPSSFAISAGTQNPDLAYALVKYLSSGAAIFGALPARRSLTDPGGLSAPFPAEVQPLISQGFANSLTYSDLLFTDYLNSIHVNQSADAGVPSVQTNAMNDLRAASAKKATLALAINEPAAVSLPPGKVALNFNIVTSIQPFPTRDLWDSFIQSFVTSDRQVGAIHLQVVSEPATMAANSSDCFYLPSNAVPTLPDTTVLDIGPLMSADPTFNAADLMGGALAAVQRGDKTYAMPLDIEPLILRYDQGLFNAAKLSAPSNDWTIENFADALQALKPGSSGNAPFVDSGSQGTYLLVLIADYGGIPIDYRTSPPTINFTAPATVTAIRQVLDLARNGYLKYTALGTLFSQPSGAPDNTTALYTSQLDGFTGKKTPPGTPPDTTVFFPTGHQYNGVAYDLGTAYISATTQYPEACYRFISALAQHPELFPTMPARHSLLSSSALKATISPDVLALYNRIDQLLHDPNTIPFPVESSATIGVSDMLVQHWLFEAFDAYVLNDNDLDAALHTAESYANGFLTCTANMPVASIAGVKGGGSSLKPYVDCAERVDPRLKPTLARLVN